METIKRKVVPMHYDKENKVLYFGVLSGFDDSEYKYLKQVEDEEYRRYFDYMINFKKNESMLEKKYKELSDLQKLIKRIYRRVESEKLLFGVPIGIERNKNRFRSSIRQLKGIEKREFRITDVLDNLTETENAPIVTAVKPSPIKVGHGLSIAFSNGFVYDCGGSISGNKYCSELEKHHKTTEKISVLISHQHYDHYKYMEHILEHWDKSIIITGSIFGGKNFKAILKRYRKRIYELDKGKKARTILRKYGINVSKGISNYSDKNFNSIVAWDNSVPVNVLLTGDTSYKILSKTIIKNTLDVSNIDFFQVPHHGSAKTSTGSPKLVLGLSGNVAYISANGKYGLPDAKTESDLASKGFTIKR